MARDRSRTCIPLRAVVFKTAPRIVRPKCRAVVCESISCQDRRTLSINTYALALLKQAKTIDRKRNGGGDRSRTCIAFRPAVFKTAAIPLCDPSRGASVEYTVGRQKAESRRRKADGRRQEAQGRRQKADGRRQKAVSSKSIPKQQGSAQKPKPKTKDQRPKTTHWSSPELTLPHPCSSLPSRTYATNCFRNSFLKTPAQNEHR